LTEALLAVGAEREGIFRVAGDSDIITELKVRIERGQYTLADLQGFDADSDDAETDVAVLTSLLKLWLRELDSPLIPDDM
jgi:Rho GTPase-activating protein 39